MGIEVLMRGQRHNRSLRIGEFTKTRATTTYSGRVRLLIAVTLSCAACASDGGQLPDLDPERDPGPEPGPDASVDPGPISVGDCNAVSMSVALERSRHVEVGTSITWGSNPPASGAHYGTWAAWDREYPQLDRGYYVHNLEHGGVVLLYHCKEDCPDVVKALNYYVRNAPVDPICNAPLYNRMLVVPDPLLPEGVQVAAVSWGKIYTASCLDRPSLHTFVAANYGRAPETSCGDGNPFSGRFITRATTEN
jgi:hypothetical protein